MIFWFPFPIFYGVTAIPRSTSPVVGLFLDFSSGPDSSFDPSPLIDYFYLITCTDVRGKPKTATKTGRFAVVTRSSLKRSVNVCIESK